MAVMCNECTVFNLTLDLTLSDQSKFVRSEIFMI